MIAYDVYNQLCPSRLILDGISNKWTILIVYKLREKTWQFGELKREIGGISAKVLTQCLRQLEMFGFLTRTVRDDALVIRVDYSLTTLGNELANIFLMITQWTEANADKIVSAQQSYNSVSA